MLIEIVRWFCWLVMIVALGGIAVFLILEPFWRRKGPVEKERAVTIRGDAKQMQEGMSKAQAAVEKMIDESKWHKRSLTITITESELLDCVRPYEMTNLINEKTRDWAEELKDEGYTVGSSDYYWDPMRDPGNGDRVVRIVANVIKPGLHARES